MRKFNVFIVVIIITFSLAYAFAAPNEFKAKPWLHLLLFDEPSLSSITISGPSQVNESSGAQYTCTAHYSDGSEVDVTNSATWSENTSFTSISSIGYLTTGSVGADSPSTITATYGGRQSNTHMVIIINVPPSVVSLTISGPNWVFENSGAQYTCTALYSDDSTVDVTNSATWSENTSFTSISSTGYLTTGSVGADSPSTITATYGGQSDTQAITVVNVPPPSLVSITISGLPRSLRTAAPNIPARPNIAMAVRLTSPIAPLGAKTPPSPVLAAPVI